MPFPRRALPLTLLACGLTAAPAARADDVAATQPTLLHPIAAPDATPSTAPSPTDVSPPPPTPAVATQPAEATPTPTTEPAAHADATTQPADAAPPPLRVFVDTTPLGRQLLPGRWVHDRLPEAQPEPEYPDYDRDNDLGKARAQVLAGEYRRAVITLSHPVKGDRVEIALLKAQALSALGRNQAALDALQTPEAAAAPAAAILRARLLGDATRFAEAIELLRSQVAAHPDSVPAHFYLAWYTERAGDPLKAKDLYGWFVERAQDYLNKWLGQPDSFNDAEAVVLIGRGLDRWATLNLQYQDNPRLHNVILGMFTRAYDVIDRDNPPAHLAAARFFLAHDSEQAAGDELQQVLKANPHSIEALALLGEVQLDAYNPAAAYAALDAIREVDLANPAATLLEARCQMFDHQPRRAADLLAPLVEARPNDLEAIGLLAGAEALMLHDDRAAALLKRADAVAPDSPTAYFEVARQLDRLWQYDRAIKLYATAVARAPWFTSARNDLGMAYTQDGDEDSARAALDAAHTLDPFNVKTTNYLRVLDQMQKFERAETPHFTLLAAPHDAPVVMNYFGDYMEQAYQEVTADFRFEPERKTIIEVFPTSDAFAVRTAGMPGLETFGASFGPVVTAIAPRPGETMGAYNWARVIRHEFTHVMNMAQTHNRCPRWFTEGLAVWEEHVPFRFAWVPQELYQRATNDKLFPISELPEALRHPKKGQDGEMAYMEGFWIVRYLREAYGPDSVVKLLQAFRDGRNEAEAFPAVTGKSMTLFQSDFFAWSKAQVAPWGYDEPTGHAYDELVKKGQALIDDHKYVEAVDVWEQAGKLRPLELLPHERLAGLYISKAARDPRKAIDHLKQIQSIELKDDRYAKTIARLYQGLNDLPAARDAAMLAVDVSPFDVSAHELLLSIAQAANDDKAVDRETKVIDDLKRIAEQDKEAKEAAGE